MTEKGLNKYALALRSLDARTFARVLVEKCISFNHYYIMGINLSSLRRPAPSRLVCRLARLETDDFARIVNNLKTVDPMSRRELIGRVLFYEGGLKNCYAMKARNNELACLQWIIYPSENELLAHYFPRQYYPLREGQVMLEKVFVFPSYRGLGLLQTISWELLEKARGEGFKSGVGYVRKDVIASINEFISMGFRIRKLVSEYKVLGYTKRAL